jgi:hypothetical protein
MDDGRSRKSSNRSTRELRLKDLSRRFFLGGPARRIFKSGARSGEDNLRLFEMMEMVTNFSCDHVKHGRFGRQSSFLDLVYADGRIHSWSPVDVAIFDGRLPPSWGGNSNYDS